MSNNIHDALVLGADSVIDLNGELISKPENREEAYIQKIKVKAFSYKFGLYIQKRFHDMN